MNEKIFIVIASCVLGLFGSRNYCTGPDCRQCSTVIQSTESGTPGLIQESLPQEPQTGTAEIDYLDNGCLPATAEEMRFFEHLGEPHNPVSGELNYNLIQYTNHSEYLDFTDAFKQWLEERAVILRNIGYVKILPFNVVKTVAGFDWQISNQGNYNSCATFGFTNAYQATGLYNIACESGQYHRNYNPMFLYRNTSGGSGGRTLSEILNFNFEKGQSDIDAVGVYPSLSGTDGSSAERCCNAVRLTNTEQVIACLKAGIGVYIGNSTAVKSSQTNKDGLRQAVIGGSWSHSTAFIGYVSADGIDYFLWRNSHGERYAASDCLATPKDCCWFDTAGITKMMTSANSYGGSFAILPESVKL